MLTKMWRANAGRMVCLGTLLLVAGPGAWAGQVSSDVTTLIKFLKANNDAYQGNLNADLVVPAPGILANDITAIGTPTLSVVTQPSHGEVSLNQDGSFTYTPEAGFSGQDAFQYRLTLTPVTARTKSSSAIVSISVPDTEGNVAPLITSALTATGHINTPFSYTITGLGSFPLGFDADNLPSGFTLDGDTNVISATPTGSGTGIVDLAAANGAGNDLRKLTINIIGDGPGGFLATPPSSPTSNSDTDTDGDGFSDELENAVGTSANSASANPANTDVSNALRELDLLSIQAKLNFGTPGKDSLTISGELPVSAGLNFQAEGLLFDIGGVIVGFTLDEKGAGESGTAKFKAKFPIKNGEVLAGVAKFKLTIKAADLRDGSGTGLLSDEGMVSDQTLTNAEVLVPVAILFNNEVLINRFSGFYTSKAGATGKYKFKLQ